MAGKVTALKLAEKLNLSTRPDETGGALLFFILVVPGNAIDAEEHH